MTDGGGFLGRRIVERLDQRGAKTIGIRTGEYDLKDAHRVRTAIADAGPTTSRTPRPSWAVDGSRANRLLGGSPKVGIEEGLERTVEWYHDRQRHEGGA